MSSLRSEIASAESREDAVRADLDALQAVHTSAVSSLTAQVASLESAVQSVESSLEESRLRCVSQDRELGEWLERYSDLEREKESVSGSLQGRVCELEGELGVVRSSLADREGAVTSLRRELSEQVANHDEACRVLTGEVSRLQQV